MEFTHCFSEARGDIYCHPNPCQALRHILSPRSIYCLFWVFLPFLNFHSFGDVIITLEGLHILTYARHLWPFSSEGSLACHTYYDTDNPFIMVISEDPWHSYVKPSVWQCVLTTYVCRGCDYFKLTTFHLRAARSNWLRYRGGPEAYLVYKMNFLPYIYCRRQKYVPMCAAYIFASLYKIW